MMTHLYLASDEIKKRVAERFRCRTPKGNGVKPHLIPNDVYGNHASYVENDGYRYWGFVSQQGRDMFVADFYAEEL